MGFFKFLGNVEHNVGHAVSSAEHGTFNFLKPVGQAASSIASTAGHVATIIPNEAKAVTGFVTGNEQAGQNAFKAAGQGLNDVKNFAQAIPRGIVQLRQSAAEAVDPNNPTTGDVTPPSSGIGHVLLGDQPIQTLQHQYQTTKEKTGSTAEAAGGAVLSFLGDYAGGKSVLKGGINVGEKGAAAASTLAENATPLNQIGAINPGDLNELSKAKTTADVQKTLDGKVDPATIKQIAPAIVATKDPGIIDNIITRAGLPAGTADAIKANGGITTDLQGNQPTSGYSYAPFKHTEVTHDAKSFTDKQIDDYVDQHFDEINQPGNHFGAWVNPDDGKVYFDISKVGPAHPDTIAKAQGAKQLAVYDLEHGNEIPTGQIDQKGVYSPLDEAANIHASYRGQIEGANQAGAEGSVPGEGLPSEQPAPAAAQEVAPPAAVTEPAVPTNPERGYTTSQKEADNYSPELKNAIGGNYRVAGDQEAVDNANKLIESQGVDKTHEQILNKLQSSEQVSKQDIITGGTVVSHLDAMGKTAQAGQLHELLAERGTTSGQASQAFNVLLRRSPRGLVDTAEKAIQKGRGEIQPEVEKTLENFRQNIEETLPGSPEREEGVRQLQKYVNSQIPSSLQDKVFAVWRAGLLTGPQTVTKIVTSHAAYGALEDASTKLVGASIDKLLSLFTGQRSLVASTRGGGEGFAGGVRAGKTLITTGKDINPGTNAEEIYKTVNFGNSKAGRFFQKYVDAVGHVHGALYKPFWGKGYAESVYNQAIAAAKTDGLRGAEKEDFIQNYVEHADSATIDLAKHEADKYTFQQETALGNIATAIQRSLPAGIGKVIVPFTRIPSAIATNLFYYTPAGVAKTIIDGIKTATSAEGWTLKAQREFSQNLGRGIVGTAGIIPGIMLFNKAILTLDYPTDPKEQKLWQLEGKIPNAIKIDGQWRSLGSIGPGGSVLSIGGHMAKSLNEGNDIGTALIAGFSGGARSIEEQSYLRGVSGTLNAINDPGRYAPNFFKQEAGSIVPTGVSTIAGATDPYSRQTNSPGDAIRSRIPGIRETLPIKRNSLGQPVQAPETGLEKLLDPFQSSTSRSSPVIDELQRLEDANQGILPATIQKKTTFSGINTKLTPAQQSELTQEIGSDALKKWSDIISQPGYQHMSDQQKSARLKSSYDAIAKHQKNTFAKSNKVGRYSPDYATNRKQSKANKKFVAGG